MQRILCHFLLCCVSFLPPPLLLAAGIGKILAAHGSVKVLRAGQTLTLSRGAELQAGDKVITAGESAAQILLSNESIVRVDPNSQYKINAYSYHQKNRPDKFSSQLEVGAVDGAKSPRTEARKNKTALTKPKENYLIKTRFSQLAVYGSTYQVKVTQTKTAENEEYKFYSGAGKVRFGGRAIVIGPDYLHDKTLVSTYLMQTYSLANRYLLFAGAATFAPGGGPPRGPGGTGGPSGPGTPGGMGGGGGPNGGGGIPQGFQGP